MGDRKKLDVELNNLLDLSRRVVGVRFIFDEDEFNRSKSQKVDYKIPYCVMVKSATNGHCIKVTEENFGCFASARVLGLKELSEKYLDGSEFMDFNMYDNIEASRKVVDNLSIVNPKPYGLELGPISELEKDPDIVIIVTNPYNAMRLLQCYNYYYGTYNEFRMGGMQAMCAEITANTYTSNDIKMSMMCSGTRFLSQWGRDEMSIGIPYDKFEKLVQGVFNTADPLERDGDKERILKAYKEDNMEGPGFNMGQNYDTGYYELGKSGKR